MNRPASLAIVPGARSEERASFEAKVAFLRQPTAYLQPVDRVETRETHMSWVFLAGDRAYKLKKPVRFPYLDFSTIAQRAAACRSELRLNRRLAPDIYLDVVPLTREAGALRSAEPESRWTGWSSCAASIQPACSTSA